MKTIRAIAYTLFVFIELLAIPIFLKWYEDYFGIASDSLAIFFILGFIFVIFQLFLIGLLWASALTNQSIKEILL